MRRGPNQDKVEKEKMIAEMKRLEAEEKLSRATIAQRLGVSSATVTRYLGAIKPWCGRRVKIEEPQPI